MSEYPFPDDLRNKVNEALDRHLPEADAHPERLHRAMRYSVLNGGKRLRPILTLKAGQMVSDDLESLHPVACAVEFIHAYSLIHDDLPCMDDDDMRRGVPSCHVKFDEATAVLAGDALQSRAFEVISRFSDKSVVHRLIRELSEVAGSRNLVGGQQLDLLREEQEGTLEQLKDLHSRKTGALITGSLRLGIMAGQGTEEQLKQITSAGTAMGLAFQITDDILDVEGTCEDLGKTAGKDEMSGKLTYPSLLGLERSNELAREQRDRALQALSSFGPEADPLRALSRFIVDRDH